MDEATAAESAVLPDIPEDKEVQIGSDSASGASGAITRGGGEQRRRMRRKEG